MPQHPRELAAHRILNANHGGEPTRWQFNERGKTLELALQPYVDVNDVAPLPALAAMDLGVIYVARPLVQRQIDAGELVGALEPFIPQDLWIYAVYTQRRHNSAALTALLAFMESEMARPGSVFSTTTTY